MKDLRLTAVIDDETVFDLLSIHKVTSMMSLEAPRIGIEKGSLSVGFLNHPPTIIIVHMIVSKTSRTGSSVWRRVCRIRRILWVGYGGIGSFLESRGQRFDGLPEYSILYLPYSDIGLLWIRRIDLVFPCGFSLVRLHGYAIYSGLDSEFW
ncbi:hypothetical protein Tco_0942200 [Tanacetum coccineum]